MPIYQVAVNAGAFTALQRGEIAEAITVHHIEATGAPREFVHVVFSDIPAGNHFTAGRVDTGKVLISGLIRSGRPTDVKQMLLRKISASFSRITGKAEIDLVIGLTEIDPNTAMEYGLILPKPGAEAEWFASNKMALGGIEATGI
jgi:phenylpyruvate tautomerase PptA (4-oxalocrotonate tautomerase family)